MWLIDTHVAYVCMYIFQFVVLCMQYRPFYSNSYGLAKIQGNLDALNTVNVILLSPYIVTHNGIDCGF